MANIIKIPVFYRPYKPKYQNLNFCIHINTVCEMKRTCHDVLYHWEGLQLGIFGVHSASSRNEYQGISLGVRATGAQSWQLCRSGCAKCQSKDGSWTFHLACESTWLVTGKLHLYLIAFNTDSDEITRRICHKWSTKKYIMCIIYCLWHREG